MLRTQYEQKNGDFSDRAHIAAQSRLYPLIFGASPDRITFQSTLVGGSDRDAILDGQMGIDRVVRVTVEGLQAPLVFTVQERFRKPKFARYRDLTVTEWNHASGQPSELYKINAGLFVYGYFNEERGAFVDAVAVNTASLLMLLAQRKAAYQVRRNPKRQSFICLPFATLRRAGCLEWQLSKQNTSTL